MIYKARNYITIGVMSVAIFHAPAQTTLGTISGNVYGPDGKGLAGTKVWANIVSKVPRPVDRTPVVPVLNTISEADGSFKISEIPPGDYVLCAGNATLAILNLCGWGGAILFKMTSGLHVSGQSIHLAGGAVLQVHLDDPAGLLAANAHKPEAGLIIGLAGPHGFVPLPAIGSTVTSRDYKMLVPFNTTLNLIVSTRYFRLTDAKGVAISVGATPISVNIPTGAQGTVINLHVVGTGN